MPGSTYGDRYDDIVVALRSAGCVFAEDEATLLVDAAVSPADLDRMVGLRSTGVPLEQILGWVQFGDLRISVEPGVFVPRRRTELLAREAVASIQPGAIVVDLCCGAGAVGALILAAVTEIDLHCADLDPAAARCARRNLTDRALVHEGDLYNALPPALRGRVDVITANAPYVPSEAIELMPPEARLYEPRLALDGGRDGVDLHRQIAAGAPSWLVAGGRLLIETGRAQAGLTAAAMTAAGLATTIQVDDDLDATVVCGRLS